jgi:hypothetical protein
VYFVAQTRNLPGGIFMTTIMPASELARKAITWICEEQANCSPKPLAVLLEEAAVRFNLSPKEVEFLQRFYKEKKD